MTPQLRFPQFTDEWQIKKLDDLARKIGDRNGLSSAETVLTNSAARGVIPQTDFFDKEIAVQGNLANYYKIEKDDFVYNPRISVSAPVGPFKRNHFGSGVMSPLYSLYRFNESEVLDYFEQYLDTKYWHKYMKDVANYGARSDRMAIASNDLLGLPFPYPSKPEQEKIAEFLTAVDERIGKIEKKLELLQQYKKGVMQKIFTQQIRFKDENGNPYPDWDEHRAGELFKNVSNRQHNGDLPVLSVTQNEGVVRRDSLERKIDQSDAGINSYKVIEPDDFVISLRSFQGGIEKSDVLGISSPAYTVLRGTRQIVPEFFKHYFKREEFISRLNSTVIGIRDGKQISYEPFSTLRLPVPSTEEQQKIATFLTALDDKIKAEQIRLNSAKQWKKGLLQRMFV